MKTKNIPFIILTLLAFGAQCSIHGMLSRTQHIVTPLQLRFSHDFSHDMIRPYETNDEKFIRPIALQNIYALTSDVTDHNKLEIVEKEIISSFNLDKALTTKVYQKNGIPIGFINYYINHTPPCYQQLIPYPLGPNAHINYLAVEDTYQNQGIGTALLQHALDDCHHNSVNLVTLKTTGHDEILKKYYCNKFKFEVGRTSKSTGVTNFKKRLKPHPMSILSKEFFDWLRKFGE